MGSRKQLGTPMNLRKTILLVVVTVFLALAFSGCGQGHVPDTILPLNVANSSLPIAIVNKGYSATLVAFGGVGPYNWALVSGSLPSGISMSPAGVFSGTATATATSDITVQVTDSQKPTAAVATAALTVKVNNGLAISTTSLKIAPVNVPYQGILKATGGAPPYGWKLLSGTLPDGLKLDGNFGVIFGTATVEGDYPITVQVTDSENPAVMVQQDLTLTVGGSEARLGGNYAFLFRGFKNGKQVLQAGSFVADGKGNVTSGVADLMSTASVNTNVAVTGTYTVDSTGHGTMSLMFGPGGSVGTGTYQIANSLAGYWAFIENGDGQATEYGAGTFSSQGTIPTDLMNSKGNWVFGGYGADSSDNRYAAAGSFNLDPTTGAGGSINTGNTDANDHGSVTNNTVFNGTIGLPDATTGRGTMSFAAGSTTSTFSWYYIDDSDFIAIETDKVGTSTPLILYSMIKQTTFIPVDNTILNGNGLAELTATAAGNVPEASLGLFSLDGKGNFFATYDDNTGGTLSQNKPSGTYSVTSTGRTTFTGLSNSPIFYIANTDRGFMLGADAEVTYGEMEQQRPPAQSNASFVNVNTGGTILGPILPTQNVEVDIYTADGKGGLTEVYDTTGPGGNMMNLMLTGTYNVEMASCVSGGITFNTCGRFPIMDSNNNQVGIGYIQASLSPQRVIIMTTSPQPVLNAIEQ